MISARTLAGLLLTVIPLQLSVGQPVKLCRSTAEFLSSIGTSEPGRVIQLADGSYDLGGTIVRTIRGRSDAPIFIKAQNRGKARFVGSSRFTLVGSEHITFEGFDFATTDGPAFELRACNNIRITRNVFHLQETQRGSWILIDGIPGDSVHLSHHNRIDHNTFEKKSQLGNFITIEGTMRKQPQVSQHDRIDRNLFRDIGPRAENVLEAIRIGSAAYTLSSGYTVLEENLFERCDGDPEYVSIKSSHDTIRYNTFRECLGSLSLRHGNGSVVEGNYILGNGRTGSFLDSTGKTWTLGTGGVRFCGDDMKIVNNYFEGLTGSMWDATLAIPNGDADYGDGQPLTKHFTIRRALIAFNTMVNNKSGFEIGYDGGGFQGNWWRKPPRNMLVANNVMVGNADTLIKIFSRPEETVWEGNYMYATGTAVVSGSRIDGVIETNPNLELVRGVWKPGSRSPVRDGAKGNHPSVRTDIEGKRRTGVKDAGAFEMTNESAKRKPLTIRDVGPDAK